MRNYVIINGVNSLTIQGLAINNLPPITKPMIRTQREEIDGRDGDIVTELGYSAYDKQMEIGLYGNFDIDAIIKYFTGEGTIVFSTEPDKYYYFKILNQIDYEKLLKFKKATVTFHCQPYKYPTSETPLEEQYEYVEETGTELTLNNTEEAPMKINLKGNTSQNTTTGKNLINLNDFTASGSTITLLPTGIHLTNNDNGYGAKIIINNLLANTDYYLSYNWKNISGGINRTVIFAGTTASTSLAIFSGDTSTGGKFNTGNNTSVNIWFYANINLAGEVEYTNIQLEKSATKTAYEPYTNGASPNPDYPQEVQTVTGRQVVTISDGGSESQEYEINLGKNLCDGIVLNLCCVLLRSDLLGKS